MSITIRDVAKRADVSVATVSRVLNGSAKVSDEAKNAVLKAQKELGWKAELTLEDMCRDSYMFTKSLKNNGVK